MIWLHSHLPLFWASDNLDIEIDSQWMSGIESGFTGRGIEDEMGVWGVFIVSLK